DHGAKQAAPGKIGPLQEPTQRRGDADGQTGAAAREDQRVDDEPPIIRRAPYIDVMRKGPARRERKSVGTKAADEQQDQRHYRKQNEQPTDDPGDEPWCAERMVDAERKNCRSAPPVCSTRHRAWIDAQASRHPFPPSHSLQQTRLAARSAQAVSGLLDMRGFIERVPLGGKNRGPSAQRQASTDTVVT